MYEIRSLIGKPGGPKRLGPLRRSCKDLQAAIAGTLRIAGKRLRVGRSIPMSAEQMQANADLIDRLEKAGIISVRGEERPTIHAPSPKAPKAPEKKKDETVVVIDPDAEEKSDGVIIIETAESEEAAEKPAEEPAPEPKAEAAPEPTKPAPKKTRRRKKPAKVVDAGAK